MTAMRPASRCSAAARSALSPQLDGGAGAAAAEAGYTTVYAQSVDTRPDGTVLDTFITRVDRPKIFRAALAGAYDGWEEWYLGPHAADPGA